MASIGKKIKQALGLDCPVENKTGLSAKKLEEFCKLFAPLKNLGEDLHDRLAKYVVDGVDDEAALAELARHADAATTLNLQSAHAYGTALVHGNWGDFLSPIEPVEPAFYLRLAKVLEAAARKLPPDRFVCQADFEQALWLEILLQEGTRTTAHHYTTAPRITAITGELIAAMLKADGREAGPFVTAPFKLPNGPMWDRTRIRDLVTSVAEIGSLWARHRELIVPFLMAGKSDQRLFAVECLARAQPEPPVEAFLTEIIAGAVCDSKRVREVADSLLARHAALARPSLEEIARSGSRSEREHAIRLLGRLSGQEVQPFFEELLAVEKSAPIKEVLENVLTNLSSPRVAEVELPEFPPHVPLPDKAPITPALREPLQRVFDEYNDFAQRHNEQFINKQPNTYIYPNHKLDSLVPKTEDEACRLLAEGGDVWGFFEKTIAQSRIHGTDPKGPLKAFLEHPDCQLIHVLRFLAMIHEIHGPASGHPSLNWTSEFRINAFRRTHEPKITLRHIADGLRGIKLPDDVLVEHILCGYQQPFDWESDVVLPFFADKIGRLEQAFEPPSGGDYSSKWRKQQEVEGAIRILAKFPHVPPQLVGRLWDLSISTNKADRLRAQKVAAKLPDLVERLTKALGSGNFQTRMIAAEWLGRVGDKSAVPALDAAAKKEKQDAALDEILTALEKLGVPMEPYLDRDKLEADVAKGLKKGIPEALHWFPWAGLPKVHWRDTKKEIPAEVITWLIVQNYKLKSSEAGPLLRRYCDLMRPDERESLGKYVLSAWLDQDLKRKHTDAEARAEAKKRAPQTYQIYQQALQYYVQQKMAPPPSYNNSLAQVEEEHFQALCRECGSASSEKGVLAVAGACGGDATVLPVQRYLKEWFGYRAAQCKALIAMLSAIDRPAAIQYLLSIANRFRTKGIREEAEKYVNILAERKGWTLDELADRTMPTAGFDDDGTLELNYGPRAFAVRINGELEAVLADSTGKVLKNLPDSRQDDDADLAKASKAAFSAAKKELKQFAGLQATRLYEAMCTQRVWPVDDWRRYLFSHPLLKFLCQRLIWAVCDGDQVTATFRPLDDGTFTDPDDNEFSIPEDAKIRIVHGCQVAHDVGEAWRKHQADYDVTPLFQQFGRAAFSLPADKRTETAIEEFQGYTLEAFKLRGMATKAGYTRGQAEDGGWFYEYLKPFPGMGLVVHLGFSGNGLPEENRPVAMTTLSFQKSAPKEMRYAPAINLPLGDIPTVLLTECYNDLASIAKSGAGFDPEWEKKVY